MLFKGSKLSSLYADIWFDVLKCKFLFKNKIYYFGSVFAILCGLHKNNIRLKFRCFFKGGMEA